MERNSTRVLSIAGGIAAALAGFALLFWAISFFVPRFLRAAGDPGLRLIFILAMAFIVLLNVFQRYRRRTIRAEKMTAEKQARKPRSSV